MIRAGEHASTRALVSCVMTGGHTKRMHTTRIDFNPTWESIFKNSQATLFPLQLRA
jgi:hypothetical protein